MGLVPLHRYLGELSRSLSNKEKLVIYSLEKGPQKTQPVWLLSLDFSRPV